MPASETIRVENLKALQLAFKAADKAEAVELRTALREAAEPVRRDAERLAEQNIPRIGVPWSRMRVGVTLTSVYVAPKLRRGRNPNLKRPNLAGLLLGRSMEPALEQNHDQVVRRVDEALQTVGKVWEG